MDSKDKVTPSKEQSNDNVDISRFTEQIESAEPKKRQAVAQKALNTLDNEIDIITKVLTFLCLGASEDDAQMLVDKFLDKNGK